MGIEAFKRNHPTFLTLSDLIENNSGKTDE